MNFLGTLFRLTDFLVIRNRNQLVSRLILVYSIFAPPQLFSQDTNYEGIHIKGELTEILNSSLNKRIITRLDTLLFQITNAKIEKQIIYKENQELTIAVLKGLQGIKSFNNSSKKINLQYKQLISFNPVSKNIFSISVALLDSDSRARVPVVKTIFRFIAIDDQGDIKFSIPLQHMTREWKSSKIENTTYYFRDTIRVDRALKFSAKNSMIAKKLQLPIEEFKFYMCENYQEILKLLGYEYHLESAFTTRLGYGVEKGYIFSIMNNEDFSHDVFHHYSGKINKSENRNWIAEEGIACSWGNAYYTDKNGEMIELKQLVRILKRELLSQNETTPYHLFKNDTKIYNEIAPELSVRSVISGLLCDEVEREKGIDGILKLINSGRKPNSLDAYIKTLDDLINVNASNFNQKINALLQAY